MRFWVSGCQIVPSRPKSFRKVLEERTGCWWKAGVTPASSLCRPAPKLTAPRTHAPASCSGWPAGGQTPSPARSRTFSPHHHSNSDAGNKTQQAGALSPQGASAPPRHVLRRRPPPQDGPQLFAMNVTFILLGCVQSQVRLLQIEYRNIHFSFQKGLLNVKSN